MSNIDNKDLVRKAIISATDALSSNGKLNNAQANKFLDFVFDETMLSKVARTVRFRNENLDIDKLQIGSRAALPKSEGIDPGYRRGLSTSQVTLTPKEIMVPFEITDTFLAVNLEGKNVENHIIQMFARQLANDLEELYIHGDAQGRLALEQDVYPGGSSTAFVNDPYIKLFDGIVNLADSGNSVNIGGSSIGIGVFADMLNAMPSKFRRDKSKLRFICSLEMETLYREKLASRGTAMGDAAVQGGLNLTPMGIPLVPVPLMSHYIPVTEEVTLSGTTAQSLSYGRIQAGSLKVVEKATANGNAPFALRAETTDYTVDMTAGTITRVGSGNISSGAVCLVTYNAYPQIILTHMSNIIIGLGYDVKLERDRDIFRGVNQYALSVKAAVQLEETDAVVKAFNIDDEL